MEVKPGFLALCPFCPPQPFAGVGVHPQGDAGSSETGLVSLPPPPSQGLWVCPRSWTLARSASAEAGGCAPSSESTAGEHR